MGIIHKLVHDRVERMKGIYVAVTRRCPLACAHCSTRSHPSQPEIDNAQPLQRFFESILTSKQIKPKYVFFTGGEPLLHPELVLKLAAIAKQWGAWTQILTSGFFGRAAKLSAKIAQCLASIDSFSMSWDRYHAEFLTIEQSKRAMNWAKTLCEDASVQYTLAPNETELDIERVKAHFMGIPVFVSPLGHTGRAADLGLVKNKPQDSDLPCHLASWPVISYYGQIISCCNQTAVDCEPNKVPAHLNLGTIWEDTWDDIVTKRMQPSILDYIETFGPAGLVENPKLKKKSRCAVCLSLSNEQIKACHMRPNKAFYDSVKTLRRKIFTDALV